MESAEEADFVLVKLSDGEDVFAGLTEAAKTHGIESGVILWGIGMLQDFELGFFGPQGYEKRFYEDRHELLAFHGSMAMRAEPPFHIHVALGRRDHAVVGGHLFRARACMVNEICLTRFRRIRLDRQLNEKTTLRELVIYQD